MFVTQTLMQAPTLALTLILTLTLDVSLTQKLQLNFSLMASNIFSSDGIRNTEPLFCTANLM